MSTNNEIYVQNMARPLTGLPVGFRPTLRAHTPDPNGYTPIRQSNVYMEGESVAGRPLASLVPGARGTMIPRATRDGASRGVDHLAPQVVNIDPHIAGGVVVDLAQIDPESLAQAVEDSNYEMSDPAEAAFAAYARVADPNAAHHPDNHAVLMHPRELQPRQSPGYAYPGQVPAQGTVYGQQYAQQGAQYEQRQAPLQMSGSYVVPRAGPGGGQVAPPVYVQAPPPPVNPQQRPRRQPAPGVRADGRQPVQEQVMPEAYDQYAPPPPAEQYTVPASFVEQPEAPIRKIRAPLQQAFQQPPTQQAPSPTQTAPLVQVTFELPQGGQFECAYHAILVERQNLVLVLDHRQFMQMRYFPPACEEPVAVLVHAKGREPERLFLCHTTGVRFRHEHNEYCILLIEQERDLQGQQAEV